MLEALKKLRLKQFFDCHHLMLLATFQKANEEKEKTEERLAYLEKSLEDKSNECVFLSEESQVTSFY